MFNLVDPKNAKHYLGPRNQQLLKDIRGEVERIVPVTKGVIVTANMECPGAECGSVFFELQTKEDSETLIEKLVSSRFEGRDIKAVCVPEEAYVDFYRKKFEA